jgi:hypothetical protein
MTGAKWYQQQVPELRTLLEQAFIYDAYFDAIVGVALLPRPVLLYSLRDIMVELRKRRKMRHDAAHEYLQEELVGGWHGTGTPYHLADLYKVRRPEKGYLGIGIRGGCHNASMFWEESKLPENPRYIPILVRKI